MASEELQRIYDEAVGYFLKEVVHPTLNGMVWSLRIKHGLKTENTLIKELVRERAEENTYNVVIMLLLPSYLDVSDIQHIAGTMKILGDTGRRYMIEGREIICHLAEDSIYLGSVDNTYTIRVVIRVYDMSEMNKPRIVPCGGDINDDRDT